MDHEAEVIREQMDDTRESLAKKLETLEKDIVGAVQNVTGTVEAVSQTVEQVKDAALGTVESVKDTVGETVDSVKEKVRETFDIPGHVQHHPWLAFGCSFAAGFLTGRLVPPVLPKLMQAGPSVTPWAAPSISTLAGPGRHDGWRPEARREEPPAAPPRQEAPPPQASGPGWMEGLAGMIGPELGKLKGLAIGAMLGMARDAITRALPQEMASQVKDVINDFTGKLGGEVMHGPVLGPSGGGPAEAGPHQPPRGPAASSGPGW